MGSMAWRFDGRELNYVREVLESGFLCGSSGTMNQRFERAFADKMGLAHAVACANGTVTLHTALWALGVGNGDEVIVTPLTVISCMNAILYCNAIPVFADIDPKTFLVDPADIRRKITPRTKAIMAVNLYGGVCDMTAIMEIAKEHNLGVLEDCAQCYLGKHRGRVGGTIGHIGSWSLEQTKHLTIGDGGIVATNDETLALRMRSFATQGFRNLTADSGRFRIPDNASADEKKRLFRDIFQSNTHKRHDKFGCNYRLPEVAAAVGLGQVEKMEYFVSLRQQSAKHYDAAIADCPWLIPQYVAPGDENSYFTYALRMANPDVPWADFRSKYIELNNGGSVFAAWQLLYNEGSIGDVREKVIGPLGYNDRFVTEKGICPQAELVQPQLMQFATNQHTEEEMKREADSLYRTWRYFA